tara:strand:- start:363 stop:647 length:285 start_codon:yes stop_codon:yes gene_type:complete
MLDWRDFVLLKEIKNLPVEEQKRLYLSEQSQHEFFREGLITEGLFQLLHMQSMAAGSGGPRKDLTSTTSTADQELTTQDGRALLTEAGVYLITQ